MWKVLLVEDEAFVRGKLRRLGEWEAQGFTVVGEASNGLEALKIMKQTRIDLVITDIMMPELDGLGLLRISREEGLDSRFIMLTCLNEFEYARQALEYGASGYILKLSMSITSLQSLLEKVGKELSERNERRNLLVARELDDYQFRVWQAIRSPDSVNDEDIRTPAMVSQYQTFVKVFMITSFYGERPSAIASKLLSLTSQKTGAEPLISSFIAGGLATFFLWFETEPVIDYERLASLETKGIYSPPFPPRSLAEEWKRQLCAMDTLWFSNQNGVAELKLERPREAIQSAEFVLSWQAEKEAIAAFEQLRGSDLIGSLTAYWQYMEQQRMGFTFIRETAYRLDRIFAGIARKTDASITIYSLESAVSHSELLEKLLLRARWLLEAMTDTQSSLTDHPEINLILKHLHQHYSENITLQAMATMISMEKHYLSRLFKQKTGSSFIAYIQMLRIEKAKLLLQETELSIGEIGLNTGFPNENYFIKTFKKWCNHTPGQYRKNASRKSPGRD